jgi:adhesin HecA-like repeat protein
VGDELLAVIRYTANLVTRTDEKTQYTVTSADTIDNTAGTSSAGQFLAVVWRRP